MASKTSKTPQRAQRKRTTPRPTWKSKFLEELSVIPNVRRACDAASVSRAKVYSERAKNAEFAQQWDQAIEEACDRLEEEAHRRAVKGTVKPLVSRGQVVFARFDEEGNLVASADEGELRPVMIHEYSDALMQTLLKAHRPEKYRERFEVRQVEGESEVDEEIKRLTKEMNERAAGGG